MTKRPITTELRTTTCSLYILHHIIYTLCIWLICMSMIHRALSRRISHWGGTSFYFYITLRSFLKKPWITVIHSNNNMEDDCHSWLWVVGALGAVSSNAHLSTPSSWRRYQGGNIDAGGLQECALLGIGKTLRKFLIPPGFWYKLLSLK